MERQPGQKRRSRQTDKNRKKRLSILRRLMLLFFLGIIVLGGLNYFGEVFKFNLVKTEVAKYGHLQSAFAFDGIIIRDESVLSVPSSGKLRIIAPEGKRVRVGAHLATIDVPDLNSRNSIDSIKITSPAAGVVSYNIDGLEKLLTPDNIQELDVFAIWEENQPQKKSFSDGQSITAGQNIIRVINNLAPIAIMGEIKKDELSFKDLKSSKKVRVQLGSEEKPVYLDIVDIKLVGDNVRLILELNNFSSRFIQKRVHQVFFINERFEGYIVPAEAIVNKDSKPGIYIVHKKVARWKPIEIVGKIDEKVAILGIEPKTSYIVNPQYVKEGQSIN